MNNYIALHKSCAKKCFNLETKDLKLIKLRLCLKNDQQHFTQSCTTSENCKLAKRSKKLNDFPNHFQLSSTNRTYIPYYVHSLKISGSSLNFDERSQICKICKQLLSTEKPTNASNFGGALPLQIRFLDGLANFTWFQLFAVFAVFMLISMKKIWKIKCSLGFLFILVFILKCFSISFIFCIS